MHNTNNWELHVNREVLYMHSRLRVMREILQWQFLWSTRGIHNLLICLNLVEKLSSLGLTDTLKEYYDNPFKKEAKSIVAGPSFLQFLNRLFQIQITPGDIIHLESADQSKYYMLSTTGTWDEIIKLQ